MTLQQKLKIVNCVKVCRGRSFLGNFRRLLRCLKVDPLKTSSETIKFFHEFCWRKKVFFPKNAQKHKLRSENFTNHRVYMQVVFLLMFQNIVAPSRFCAGCNKNYFIGVCSNLHIFKIASNKFLISRKNVVISAFYNA